MYHTDISTMDMKRSFGNFLTKIYYNIFLYLPNLFLQVCYGKRYSIIFYISNIYNIEILKKYIVDHIIFLRN